MNYFGGSLDYILYGKVATQARPTVIKDALTDIELRSWVENLSEFSGIFIDSALILNENARLNFVWRGTQAVNGGRL